MRILITNDDGINSPGLLAVLRALKDEADCLVVAPHKQCSATGHSITLYHHISVEIVSLDRSHKGYSIEGTPADCVKFAVSELSKKKKIDLIISGINLGLNSGVSVYYSGTVSAAREGLINGIPSIALSQGKDQVKDFSYAAKLVQDIVHGYRHRHLPSDTFLNINIPPIPSSKIKGVRVTKQAHSRFIEWFETGEASHSNGKKSYYIYGDLEVINPDGTSDEEALRRGYVSITPLHLDLTHYGRMGHIEDWVRKRKSTVHSPRSTKKKRQRRS